MIVDELVLAIDGLFLSVCKISEMTTQFLDLTLLNKIKRENETLIDKVFDVKASVEQKNKMNKKVIDLRGRISMLIDKKWVMTFELNVINA
ncbi:hypothetical protein NG896_20950 [Aeromonas veronii]|uniref:Uncharacterized protein n=1 Tax=Aeromonas sp. 19NY04SH05-1 TaxID=2920537 RepID=A0AAU6TBR7_9GAMM|nr:MULTISPECIES: hypothetical protein [Aeromonas]BEE16907.1 hypothetical protein VAWG006_11600 [Aeromonas enteropelogenes]HEH9442152.1 hypothetical protein [Aeromonas sobria]EKP0314275.1 hypothetical protein [Aeromonas veronii]MBL0617284.1 hypothetical protein [Aeromonas dhakensis]MBL0625018.1 hypothetical protein [Aeromonas veronii]